MTDENGFSVHYHSMVGILKDLTTAELVALQARIKAMLSLSDNWNSEPSPPPSSAHMAISCLCEFMRREGLETVNPVTLMRIGGKLLRDKCADLDQWLDRCKLTRAQRYAVLNLGWQLLYAELRDRGACSSRRLVQEIHRLPTLIDNAFPSYARNGWLGWAIARTYQGSHHD